MLANHKGEIPFLILLLPFMAGIGLNLCSSIQLSSTFLIALLACFSVLYVTLNISYAKLNIYKNAWVGSMLIHSILFFAGFICAAKYGELGKENHFSKHNAQYLAVKVTNEPTIKNGLVRFAATVSKTVDNSKYLSASGKLLITIKDSAAFDLNYGDVLLIPAKHNVVDPPFNHAEFNYKQYLAHQNIYHQVFLYPRQYVVVDSNAGNPVIAYSLQLRRKLVAQFKANMQDSTATAVASTMILGYKADLSNDVLQAYINTGTLHVLSVSGAHVAIVFMLFSWSLSFLNRFKHGKFIKAAIIITLVCAYALLTGFSPAVNRAALMISLIISGNSFYRYINPLNLLAASAFALLLYSPYYLMDVGFQLSYLAVGGLIVFQPVIYNSWQIENKWLDKLWALCSVSIAAQIITFPLSAYYFHQFPVYFLLSNLFILLPVIVIMYTGLAFLLLSWVSGLGKALAYILEKSIVLMNKGLLFIEHLPFASFNKLWINTFDYLLMYGIIISIFYFMFNREKKKLTISLVLMFVLSVSAAWKKIDAKNNNAITFLNLKKQRVIVFKSGTNAAVLSDLQPSDKNYKYSVQPGLDSTKVENATVYHFNQDINLPFIKKQGKLIRFMDKTLVLVDSSFQNFKLNSRLKTDYVYITHNPPISVEKINENLSAALLVIGADNSDRFVDSFKKQSLQVNKHFYTLKRNKALNLTID